MTTNWEDQGACRDHPIAWWFPEKALGADNHGRQAKAICATCPVIRECLEAALDRGEDHGIWGGAGEDQRRGLNRLYQHRHTTPDAWSAAIDRHLRRLTGERLPPENRNGPNATDGLRVTYNRGCRCRACRLAVAEESAASHGHQPPLPTRPTPDEPVALPLVS